MTSVVLVKLGPLKYIINSSPKKSAAPSGHCQLHFGVASQWFPAGSQDRLGMFPSLFKVLFSQDVKNRLLPWSCLSGSLSVFLQFCSLFSEAFPLPLLPFSLLFISSSLWPPTPFHPDQLTCELATEVKGRWAPCDVLLLPQSWWLFDIDIHPNHAKQNDGRRAWTSAAAAAANERWTYAAISLMNEWITDWWNDWFVAAAALAGLDAALHQLRLKTPFTAKRNIRFLSLRIRQDNR